jgi:hypothetical protein
MLSDNLCVWRSPAMQTDTTVCDRLVQLVARDDVPAAALCLRGDPQCSVSRDAVLPLLMENDCPQLACIRFAGSVVLTEDYLRLLELEGARHPILDCIAFSGKNFSHFEPMHLQDFFRRCQFDICLDQCTIDVHRLSVVLRGDSKVKRFFLAPRTLNDANTTFLVDLLDTNKSLTTVFFGSNPIGDENWIRLCRSIERHPVLKILGLLGTGPTGEGDILSAESKVLRANAIIQMIQANDELQQVNVTLAECDEQILVEVIRPYLRYARNIRRVNANRGNHCANSYTGEPCAGSTANGNPTLLRFCG